MGEKAVYVERDCGVDCDSLSRLDALVRETSKGRGEEEKDEKDEPRERVMTSCKEVCQSWYWK